MKKIIFILYATLSCFIELHSCDECGRRIYDELMSGLTFQEQCACKGPTINKKEMSGIKSFYLGKRQGIRDCAGYMSSEVYQRFIETYEESPEQIIIGVLKKFRDEKFIPDPIDQAFGFINKRKKHEGRLEGIRESLLIIQEMHPEMIFD